MRSRHRVEASRAAAVLAALAIMLVSCGQNGSPSTGASPPRAGSSGSSATPRPTPALAFVLPEGALPPGAWATVTNGPIDLYGWPWSDSASYGQLANGARVQIEGVPIVVDGRAWVSVNADGGGGYVALQALAGALTLEPVTCPDASGLAAVAGLSPWERLSCFGGRELVLEGSEIVGFAEMMAAGDPGWLNGKGELVITPGAGWPSLAVHVPPGSMRLDRPSFDTELAPYGLRVTGHFNDPASSECRGPQATIGDEGSQRLADADPTGAELLCRERFVLTGLEVLGATPVPTTAPVDDTVLLRVDSAADVSGPWPGLRFVVFADGRLITASGTGSGWFERHLTDAARDELIGAALDEELLQKSATYPPPPNYAAGYGSSSITLRRDTGVVRVGATNASVGDTAKAVMALADALAASVQGLADDVFVDEPHVWLPTAYNLQIDLSPGVLATYPTPPEFILWADDAVLPLPTPLVDTGPVVHSEAGGTTRCSVIDATLASKLRAAFQRAGYQRSEGSLLAAEYDLGWRATNGYVGVRILAVSPDEPDDFHCALAAG